MASLATWTDTGDTLKVCDVYSDGYGIRGYVYKPYTGDEGNGTVLLKVSDASGHPVVGASERRVAPPR